MLIVAASGASTITGGSDLARHQGNSDAGLLCIRTQYLGFQRIVFSFTGAQFAVWPKDPTSEITGAKAPDGRPLTAEDLISDAIFSQYVSICRNDAKRGKLSCDGERSVWS